LIEVVFENIDSKKACDIFFKLIPTPGSIARVSCLEAVFGVEPDNLTAETLTEVSNFKGAVCVAVYLKKALIGHFNVDDVSLRFLKYDDCFDVDFDFPEVQVGNDFISFQTAVIEMAALSHIDSSAIVFNVEYD
jgi:hypothetical protein